MVTAHDGRIFASGNATTLYVTIPAQVASGSQFSFEADDAVTVTIDGNGTVKSNPPNVRPAVDWRALDGRVDGS